MARTLLMSHERVQRTLSRLAYEVVERNRGAANLSIIGVRTRGTTLAQALAAQISAIEGCPLPVYKLDVPRSRDDWSTAEVLSLPADAPDLSDRDVLLVDDVLFTGRTARAALDVVTHLGRPRTIQLAVLIDRGHREYPIQPDYLGRRVPTKHIEKVVVTVEDGYRVYVEE
jgi:pyrimidine operon attenuation protein/uracil phosphoribosyltransferase